MSSTVPYICACPYVHVPGDYWWWLFGVGDSVREREKRKGERRTEDAVGSVGTVPQPHTYLHSPLSRKTAAIAVRLRGRKVCPTY